MNTNTIVKQGDQLTIRELNLAESYLWDLLVQAAPSGCFMQAWTWADFKEIEGYKTFRYGLFVDKKLVGGCIFYLYPNSSKANLLIAPGGPLIPARCREKGMHLLLEVATVVAKEMGALALRVEPL